KRPRPRPEVPHPIPQSPDIVTLEVHLQRVSLYHVVTEVRTVLPVHEDHRRERDLFVEPRAFFQARLPERRETDQVKIAIAQEIEDLLAAVPPTGALAQAPQASFRIMESSLVRIVHAPAVPQDPGHADRR